MPFILRGVTLAGVDSVMAPLALRREAWERLARDLEPRQLESIVSDIALADVAERAEALMQGKLRGRVVVAL
jgi:acrylyl-CoA reductase (NADPH)